ncbi:MAG: glycosyltransferase [Chitinivibrionales bacterium]
MISVVVCSRYKQGLGTHQSHVMEASGVECSYIPVDNSENRFSITEAYNIGIEKAQGDIIVFMHEDVYFATPGWGRVLEDKFRNLDNPGIIGVAGSQCLLRDNPFWGACGRPFVKGKVIHQNWENDLFLTVFSEESGDFRVAGVDGLFFAVSAPALRGVRFDEENFDRFHFYDLDLCMQVNFGYSIYVTDDILVKHFSKGAFDDTWREYGARFLRKYRDRLPFSVSEIEYRPEKREQFSGVDMITQVSAPVYSYLRSLGSECRDEKKTVTNRGFTVIAGMHRSGTSCIAGLLNKCGVAAGNQEEMLNSNSAREDNKKGHFENRYAVRINDALLNIAGGNWAALPRQESIDKAGDLKGDYIKDFSGRFDGELLRIQEYH